MSSLYEMTANFETLFNRYDDIANYEFTPDGKGGFVNDDGEPVDPAEARLEMSEAWFDTLDGMELEIQEKAEAVAIYIKSLKSEYEAIEAEKKRLESRIRSKKNTVARMEKYLMDCMSAARLKKIDMPRAVITFFAGRESLKITDETKFIEWAKGNAHDDLLEYASPSIRKNAVRQCVKNGEYIPCAEIVRTPYVTIK